MLLKCYTFVSEFGFSKFSTVIIPEWLNYTNGDYSNFLIVYGECDEVISKECDTFVIRYSLNQKPPPTKGIIENLKNLGSLRAKMERNKAVHNNENVEILSWNKE